MILVCAYSQWMLGSARFMACHQIFCNFQDRISTRSQDVEIVQYGGIRIASELFADDVVLLASSDCVIQCVPEQFAPEFKATRMIVSTL